MKTCSLAAVALLLASCGGPTGDTGAPPRFAIGGTIAGLSGSVMLRNNGGDDLAVSTNGPFSFTTALTNGSTYSVTVHTQPVEQACVVANGSGTVASADVTTVTVTCTTNTYTIGGTVSGLSGSVVLRNNGGDDLAVSAGGPFTFATALASGSPYSVTVHTQPVDQTCVVANGSGTVAGANVTSVAVSCTANTYAIGGTLTGLGGVSCRLRNNGGDDLLLVANGGFSFPTHLPSGSPYNVTVASQPTGPTQTCTISNGSGTVSGADVTNIGVSCSVDRPPCNTNEMVGSLSGDDGSGVVFASGAGERWIRVHITENSLSSVYLSAAITLTSPSGVDYDLYVYCGACGGSEAGARVGPGTHQVLVRWEDRFAIDDGEDILIHVRYFAGRSASPWNLEIQGNVTVNTTTCTF